MQRFNRLAPLLISALAVFSSGCASLDPLATSPSDPRADASPAARAGTSPAPTLSAAKPRDFEAGGRTSPSEASAVREPQVLKVPQPRVAVTSTERTPSYDAPLNSAATESGVGARAFAAQPTDADLWVRIRSGFAMPALPTPLVAEKEHFYLSKPEYLQRMFQRGSRYLYYIVEELEKRGMPTELALLPFVESAMNPVALSSAQAAGLWQFIPRRASSTTCARTGGSITAATW